MMPVGACFPRRFGSFAQLIDRAIGADDLGDQSSEAAEII